MTVIHHHPPYLPPKLDYGLFARELAEAQYYIGLLQGSHGKIKNAMHLIGPLLAKEATVSSKIEGTQSTSSDVYIYDAGGRPTHQDTPVVSNYRTAMIDAINSIYDGRKLTISLIKSLHSILLKDVRHKGVLGNFRKGSVWIGEREGDPIEKAIYVPPEHMHVDSYMKNLLEYVEEKGGDISLVKAGVIHYQFEGVHPFDDGNGRIGRLLIPLILFYKGALDLPIVYSSGYFEERPNQYREALRTVDKTGKYEQWLKFFFEGIIEQAKETISLIDQIRGLSQSTKDKYQTYKSPYIYRIIDFLFKSPIFTVSMVQKEVFLKVRLTATRLIDKLVEDKVIVEVKDQKGPRGTKLYAFSDLLQIIK